MLSNTMLKIKVILLCCAMLISIHMTAWGQKAESATQTETRQLQQRIDFGNAYIMGQSIKSGAVYLLHRKQSDIESMLKIRTDYREEIKEDYALEGTEMAPEAPTHSDK